MYSFRCCIVHYANDHFLIANLQRRVAIGVIFLTWETTYVSMLANISGQAEIFYYGNMAEWSKALESGSVHPVRKGVGSNPTVVSLPFFSSHTARLPIKRT